MVELTLLHLDVDSVTAKAYAPFSKSVGEGGETDEGTGIEVERSGGSRMKAGLAATLVGLVFLLVAAVLLRRYFSEDDETSTAADFETAEVTIE